LNLEVGVDVLRYGWQYGRIAAVWVVVKLLVNFVASFSVVIRAPIWACLPVWLLIKAPVMTLTISTFSSFFASKFDTGTDTGRPCPYGPSLNSLFHSF
jgi:hypothetical protein